VPRLLDYRDEGVGGRRVAAAATATVVAAAAEGAVKGRRQTGGRHPVLIPTATHPDP
jgi:hypothetical protein